MQRDLIIVAVALAGIAAWLYSRRSEAATWQPAYLPQDGGAGFDYGYQVASPEEIAQPAQEQPGFFDSITRALSMPFTASYKTGEYPKYAAEIANAEVQYGIPTDLLARLLYQESRYRADIIEGRVKSSAGAIGIAQFMPATAAEVGIDPRDPIQSIYGAGIYLQRMHNIFGSWPDALAAYNWGPGNMQAFKRGEKQMPAETRSYIAQIGSDVVYA